jgi:hypothetical protein
MRWWRVKNPDVIDGLGGGGAVAGQLAGIPPSEDPERDLKGSEQRRSWFESGNSDDCDTSSPADI